MKFKPAEPVKGGEQYYYPAATPSHPHYDIPSYAGHIVAPPLQQQQPSGDTISQYAHTMAARVDAHINAESEFEETVGPLLMTLARRVSGRLAFDHHTIMFTFIDNSARQFEIQQGAQDARLTAQIAVNEATVRTAIDMMKPDRQSEAQPMAALLAAHNQAPSTYYAHQQRNDVDTFAARGAAGSTLNPRIAASPFPLGAHAVTKAIFYENVGRAAALISKARGHRGMNWKVILRGQTEDSVVFDSFAELVAMCIAQSATQLTNRALDATKIAEQRRVISNILSEFRSARIDADGGFTFVTASTSIPEDFDPFAEAFNVVYGGGSYN